MRLHNKIPTKSPTRSPTLHPAVALPLLPFLFLSSQPFTPRLVAYYRDLHPFSRFFLNTPITPHHQANIATQAKFQHSNTPEKEVRCLTRRRRNEEMDKILKRVDLQSDNPPYVTYTHLPSLGPSVPLTRIPHAFTCGNGLSSYLSHI